MKKSIVIVAVLFLFGTLTLTSCKTSTEKVEDAKEDVIDAQEEKVEAEAKLNEVKADSVSDYAMLKMKTNELISENERKDSGV